VTISEGTKKENSTIKSIAGNVITMETDIATAFTTPAIRMADIAIGDKEIRLENASGVFAGSIVEISGTKKEYGVVDAVIGNKLILSKGVSNKYDLSGAADTSVSSLEFTLTLKKGNISESFSALSVDSRHPRFFSREVTSSLVSVKLIDPPPTPTSPDKGLPEILADEALSGGGDDDLKNLPFEKGLEPLDKMEGISLLAIPGAVTQDLQSKMISHCERKRYRFAILDSGNNTGVSGTGSVQEQRSNLGSNKGFAAIYYPWFQIVDPVSKGNKQKIYIPPSGAVAGIFARSDGERGVHKAPANEAVSDIIGLEKTVTKGEQEILNPGGVNVIRFFPGRGFLVWGARTIAGDPLWKYVNVRRLFIYLEESIEKATQWVVFEPNHEKLWGRVRSTITEFLTRVWRDGMLMGTKPEEAFFVKCDRTTMTQDDIDNGKLICVIGVAPVKPAEFVIFRIAQWAGGTAVTE
jgi:hypothetical protein